jgi:hypothetical protein
MLSHGIRPGFVLLEIVLACAALAACGGGGGTADDAVAGAAPTAVAAAAENSRPADAGAAGETSYGSMLAASQRYADTAEPLAEPTTGQADVRESAQSLVIDSGDSSYRRPKVAALDYSSDSTSTRAAQLANYRFVILAARWGSTLSIFTSSIRARNASLPIAYYTIFNELDCTATPDSSKYPAVQAANKANWWLRKADGTHSQWSSAYNHCDINLSSWAPRDASGRTWQQYKAAFDNTNVFKIAPGVSYVFSDNTFNSPRVDADWKRNGTNQLRTDSTIISAQRAGQVAYWSALRGLNSSLKIIGNADNDLSAPEYAGKLNGAFMEGAMGRSYSLETWAGWDRMMERYRGMLRNTASPKSVFMQVYGDSLDFRQMRFGLASALLEDGYYVYLPSSGTLKSAWYDEYEAPLGDPIEAPPTAPKQNGIWMRRYSNGVVLVNPSKTASASIDVGTAYKRLKGTQNPSVNSGLAQSVVTLSPRAGLIMIKR